jgi:hypothetical protein
VLDARTELEKLKHMLILRNLPEQVASSICEDASREISDIVIDLIADAMAEAVSAGQSVNSSDFIKEVMMTRRGGEFDITTRSGRSDFSEPPFPMLPKLLANAKTAADGSLYKIIPLKEKSSVSSIGVTTEEAIKNINENRAILKQQKKARLEANRGTVQDPFADIDVIAAMTSNSVQKKVSEVTNAQPNFKTASSKQDANAKWVRPAKDADLTSSLIDINHNLHYSIDSAIENIIRRYGDMY